MRHSNLPASRGFTLVEVLVGLVLGLIAIVIMYQVFATFESQRRTSVAGGDAQSAGHLSLYSMERELRLAGLGLMYLFRDVDTYDSQSACPVGVSTYSAKSGVVTAAPGIPGPFRCWSPIAETGYGANSDSLVITYGPSAASGAPIRSWRTWGRALRSTRTTSTRASACTPRHSSTRPRSRRRTPCSTRTTSSWWRSRPRI